MFPRLRVAILIMASAIGFRTSAQTTSGNKSPAESKQQTPTIENKPDSIESRVEKYLRDVYAWGPSFDVKVGPTKPSQIPDLLEVPVSISMGGQSDNATVYVSKDGKYLIRGELDDMSKDPLADIRSKLHVDNSPSSALKMPR